MLDVTINKQYCNQWNDNIELITYANEVCKEYDTVTYINHHGSKRQLLLSLLTPLVISDEAALIIKNIFSIKKIELLEQTSEMSITTDNNDMIEVKGVSPSFIEMVKKL